ncbi:hypothetical protein CGCA056_v006534 [Colletotrichum aenigma]|uniref:uncharacterized protein n=1 Tax=Colletotrichum aenigma TaxID=1215731 RepID=UPI001872627C|nr:uncharacterized protein CGCA056_v006534 [Colletotrichum aenigma]KAF5521167.1 hypothetical protein CGCA056_v006534 [Colletotrichum aenigma]
MTRKAPQPYQGTTPGKETHSWSPQMTQEAKFTGRNYFRTLIVLCALVSCLIGSQLLSISRCAGNCILEHASPIVPSVPVETAAPFEKADNPLKWYIAIGFGQNRCVGSISPFASPQTNRSDPAELLQRIGDKFKSRGDGIATFDKHYTISLKLSEAEVQNHLDTVCALLKVPGARGFISYWPGEGGSLKYSNYVGAFDDDTLVMISKLAGVLQILPTLASGDRESWVKEIGADAKGGNDPGQAIREKVGHAAAWLRS